MSMPPPLKIPRTTNVNNSQKHSSVSAAFPVIPPPIRSFRAFALPISNKYTQDLPPALLSVSSPTVPPSWSCASLLSPSAAEIDQTRQATRRKQNTDDFIVEFKASNKLSSYHRMSKFVSNQVSDYLNKSLVAFWVKNHSNDAFLLLDFETMQQFNVSTGYRRTIRCRQNSSQTLSRKRKHFKLNSVDLGSAIDLTSSNFAQIHGTQSFATSGSNTPVTTGSVNLAQPAASHGITHNLSGKGINQQQQVEVCGAAYKPPVLCGQVARRKLAQIRLLQLSRCKFVQDMRLLPREQRLFNPDPIPEEDPRFPIEQIRYLERGGLTVHEVLPSTTWTRNHRYFNLLYEEERKLYAAHATSAGPAKIKHFAWHGAPADCIRGILEYGFLVGPTPRVGNRYGHGVYLSTESFGRYSMNPTYSQPDLSGFRFMLLCEVLPGTVEASSSKQTRPSSLSVHSGVDQLPGASMHVFYTFDMNVRVSPKYVVVIHPPVTEAIMNSVPNELQVSTAMVAETNEPSGLVVIDCT